MLPPPSPPAARINLSSLKLQIANKLGPERAQQYFGYLNQWLSQKLSKLEFNKLCLLILGRENIPLHNQLIRSILKNAFNARTPPHVKATTKPIGSTGKISPQGDDRINRKRASSTPQPTIWSNGDILPPSPRKVRSGIRDRRIKDRPSPLGPSGRADVAAHQSVLPSDEEAVRENGILGPCDLKRPMQHQSGPAERQAKRLRVENLSPHDRASVHSKGQVEVGVVEDGEEVEQSNDLNSKRGPLQAPLGIPFCPASVGGPWRSVPLVTSTSTDSSRSNRDDGELCHTEALKKWMEKIAESQALGGVTMECANLLNKGLDAYLKNLIRSCVELVGARSGHESMKHLVYMQQHVVKSINGFWAGNHMHVQSNGGSSAGTHAMRNLSPISLQDFRVAMELNPRHLGEDWPLLLEKICFHPFEE
ncbi:uncharacterized protein LOC103701524 [Phoenix dactylifera]|uniref:Uncharacterized protein LOC103701524 n=1 Tax=Phoenix dactylifera TaxID=42345 RepID=A0A8B9ANQ2_PHODC|nr:uncharacterized protein LOC103701524 [Phoenix dactylifera]